MFACRVCVSHAESDGVRGRKRGGGRDRTSGIPDQSQPFVVYTAMISEATRLAVQ